jgi:hypothetical protein
MKILTKNIPLVLKFLISFEMLYIYALVGIWTYYEVPSKFLFLAIIILVVFAYITTWLFLSENLIMSLLGLIFLSVIIAAMGIYTLIVETSPWIIFATLYSVIPFIQVLITRINKRGIWYFLLVYYSFILVSGSIYAILIKWTGYIDLVFSSLIIIVLIQKKTREFYHI